MTESGEQIIQISSGRKQVQCEIPEAKAWCPVSQDDIAGSRAKLVDLTIFDRAYSSLHTQLVQYVKNRHLQEHVKLKLWGIPRSGQDIDSGGLLTLQVNDTGTVRKGHPEKENLISST
jgi:hypothetical protein